MRRISLLVTLLAVSLGIACENLIGPEAVAGTYTLQTVNGEHSPWFTAMSTRSEIDPVSGEQIWIEMTLEWTSGSLHLNSDTAFSVTHVFRTTEVFIGLTTGDTLNTTVTTDPDTQSGTFSVTDTSIQLTYADGTVYTASLSGDVLTMMVDGVAWVWER